jgi:acylphosphatase
MYTVENKEMTPPYMGEIILYQPDSSIRLEVRVEDETVWLSLNQISKLFDRDKSVISRHISNIFKEEELMADSTVANFATVQSEGERMIERNVEYFNLDVIISVGYRVKSKQGIQFRQWANHILKDYLLKGYVINQRMERLEYRVTETEKKIDFFVKTALPPKEGVFFEGQIFDAYIFAANLIKSAKKSIILIDNYIDETVLLLLSKRLLKVEATIYTKQISPQLQLDLIRHNTQYESVNLYESNHFHDRFLLIDSTVYHIGASLKDLGKKLFAFSRMEIKAEDITKIF